MAKFQYGDIVVSQEDNGMKNCPIVILSEHTFPDGTLAYRYRSIHPGFDDSSGEEMWSEHDGYNSQSYIDTYQLIWRIHG